MREIDQVKELSRALNESGLSNGEAIHVFLKKKGYSFKTVVARGGWMRVLMDMIPSEYSTVQDLIEAIQGQGV